MSLPNLPGLTNDALAVGAVLALMAGAFLFRRLWLRLLGPMFVYEADRVARRGRTFVLRAVFVLVLFVAMFLCYPRAGTISPAELEREYTRFAEQFSYIFLIVLAAGVFFLTPVYVGGAVSDEKENRSLDFLLATRM